ncbi:MAG TPA: Maf family protein [Stenomitos sp.]
MQTETRSIQDATVVLASGSPRRAELLTQVGIPFIVDPSGADETPEPDWDPVECATRLAARKAMDVANRHPEADVILGADTIVVVDDAIFGKPRDAAHAVEMLQRLSGRAHAVITGWSLVDPKGNRAIAEFTSSRVFFDDLDAETIERYVATGEPMDKAGAYAIQGKAGLFVQAIEGDYANIVGLPIAAVGRALRQFGWHVI